MVGQGEEGTLYISLARQNVNQSEPGAGRGDDPIDREARNLSRGKSPEENSAPSGQHIWKIPVFDPTLPYHNYHEALKVKEHLH